ncbi:MAG: hypothetical protein EP335_08270 [Alphaproteobacteria bacterium]|nr:MAG: hypothetical protein EP335_08270 [Alphaproteobacteria bacterium]
MADGSQDVLVKKLYLHVGFPKTGSSFLQVLFARNAAFMRDSWSLNYRLGSGNAAARMRAGGISSGNGAGLVSRILEGEAVGAVLDRYLDDGCAASLISSEMWGKLLPEHNRAIVAIADARGYAVEAIAFKRDPFDFAISLYLQNVKRGERSPRFEEACTGRLGDALAVEARLAQSLPLTVISYETARDDLAGAFFSPLGFDAASLPQVPAERINRALSREEAHCLLALKAEHGDADTARILSDHLIENYPFTGTPLRHSQASFEAVCHTLGLDPVAEAARRAFVPQDAPLDADAIALTESRLQAASAGLRQTPAPLSRWRRLLSRLGLA